jgi:hypothetical protein
VSLAAGRGVRAPRNWTPSAGLPVPEIVLAEDPKKKKTFIVIDGKQRLLTIAGFVDPTISYWRKARLQKLKVLDDLNTKTF